VRRTEKTFPQTRTFIQIENHFHACAIHHRSILLQGRRMWHGLRTLKENK
jgi:hypothetical protein